MFLAESTINKTVLNPNVGFRGQLKIIGVSVADVPIGPAVDGWNNQGDVFEVRKELVFISTAQ